MMHTLQSPSSTIALLFFRCGTHSEYYSGLRESTQEPNGGGKMTSNAVCKLKLRKMAEDGGNGGVATGDVDSSEVDHKTRDDTRHHAGKSVI